MSVSLYILQINNYQAIVITDSVTTYSVFSYICGELQWSGVGSSGAVVGFNAEGRFYGNYPLSGYSSIAESISCPVNSGTRQKRQQAGATNLLLEMPADETLNAMIMECEMGITTDQQNYVTAAEIPGLAAMVATCPCTRKQAMNDANFKAFSGVPGCYITRAPQIVNSMTTPPFQLTLTQQCCYDNAGYDHKFLVC